MVEASAASIAVSSSPRSPVGSNSAIPATKVTSRSALSAPISRLRSGGKSSSRPSPIGSHSRLRSTTCSSVKISAACLASLSLRQAIERWAR